MLKGYDFSHNNSDEIFDKFVNNGDFVILRTTYGVNVDKKLSNRLDYCINNGKRLGLYHFMTKTTPLKKQINKFIDVVRPTVELLKQFHKSDIIPLILIVDWELSSIPFTDVKKFVDEIEKTLQVDCYIYTSLYFYNKVKDEKKYKFWVAWWSTRIVDDTLRKFENVYMHQCGVKDKNKILRLSDIGGENGADYNETIKDVRGWNL